MNQISYHNDDGAEQHRADARLMAAAPELLGALQAVAERLASDDVSTAPLDTKSARAALAWLRGAFGPAVEAAIKAATGGAA
jgi:hypothetical protein